MFGHRIYLFRKRQSFKSIFQANKLDELFSLYLKLDKKLSNIHLYNMVVLATILARKI